MIPINVLLMLMCKLGAASGCTQPAAVPDNTWMHLIYIYNYFVFKDRSSKAAPYLRNKVNLVKMLGRR